MTCKKCQSLMFSRWDHDLRGWEEYCPCCSWRAAYSVPKPTPEKDNLGRYERESSVHTCKCGRAKVPWRSSCRDCLDRWVEFDRKYTKKEKDRAANATRKAMS